MIYELLTTALLACSLGSIPVPMGYLPTENNPTPPSADYIPLQQGVYYSTIWIGFPKGREVSDGSDWYRAFTFQADNNQGELQFTFGPNFQGFWDMLYLNPPEALIRNYNDYKHLDGYMVFGDKWVYELGEPAVGNIDVVLNFTQPLKLLDLDQCIQTLAQVKGVDANVTEGYYDTWFRGIPTSLDYQAGYQDGYQDGYDAGETNGYTNGHNSGYDQGYNAGVADATAGEYLQFTWIKQVFNGMATFFNIQVLPNISLGFLMFAPLVVVAIVAIVRIIKHE